MDKLSIQSGGPLAGTVVISGAKNAALPILMAGVLAESPFVLTNVPSLRDVDTSCKLLRCLGAEVTQDGDRITIDSSRIDHFVAPYEIGRAHV